jgi:hypothetical protein
MLPQSTPEHFTRPRRVKNLARVKKPQWISTGSRENILLILKNTRVFFSGGNRPKIAAGFSLRFTFVSFPGEPKVKY